jgi:xylulokinase
MKADITGTPLQIPRLLDCELTGAAAAVFTMLDEAESISEVADSLVRIVERYEPDPVNRRTWEQMYRSYCEQRDKGSVIGPEQSH